MKKGFTLVELIAVIVILGLIMVFAIPSILSVNNDLNSSILEEEIRNLKDAAKLFALDLPNFDSQSSCENYGIDCNIYNTSTSSWEKVTVTVAKLKELGYFEDNNNNCNGNVTITKVNNGSDYQIDVSENICSLYSQ